MESPNGPTSAECIDFSRWIPVFPLPNIVLLPKAILPLHIFEQRYRIMTEDALSGPRLVAMVLLKPGYEETYHTLNAPIHEIGCIGRILREERLLDGRYNFLLQGLTRARIVNENKELRYRRAKVEWLQPSELSGLAECAYRRELGELLTTPPLSELAEKAGWQELFDCPELSFSDLVDVLGSVVLQAVEDKQELLEQPDVAQRAIRLNAILSMLSASLQQAASARRCPRAWPPVAIPN